jgi:hypothetical protein
MSVPPEGAQLSPDGNYWWDGGTWQPVSQVSVQPPEPNQSVQPNELSPDGNYRWDGTQWQSLAGQPHPVHEVTIVGDPNAPADPNNPSDSYGDGYTAGYHGKQADDSFYGEAAKADYRHGFDAGLAQRHVETPHEGESGWGELAEHAATEGASHALHLGPLGLFLSALTMSDTPLHEAPVYFPACAYPGHGTGDHYLDDGQWYGTFTMSWDDAHSEMLDHGSNYNHSDGVAMIKYADGNVEQTN